MKTFDEILAKGLARCGSGFISCMSILDDDLAENATQQSKEAVEATKMQTAKYLQKPKDKRLNMLKNEFSLAQGTENAKPAFGFSPMHAHAYPRDALRRRAKGSKDKLDRSTRQALNFSSQSADDTDGSSPRDHTPSNEAAKLSMAISPDGSSMEQYSDGSRSQSQLSQESLNSEYSQFADLGKLKPDGWEQYKEYTNTYHEQMAKYWPEPREQLHGGGKQMTDVMIHELQLGAGKGKAAKGKSTSSSKVGGSSSGGGGGGGGGGWAAGPGPVLDVCCGEGHTAVLLATQYGLDVTGIDIVPAAIERATRLSTEAAAAGSASAAGGDASSSTSTSSSSSSTSTSTNDKENANANANAVEHQAAASSPAKFVEGSVFHMPFPTEAFALIVGQDPDGFTHPRRVTAFRECHRVLRPGGRFYFHSFWIPGLGWTSEQSEAYAAFNKELGWTCERLSADAYVADLERVGFHVSSVCSMTATAAEHFRRTARIHQAKHGRVRDRWLRHNLKLIEGGHSFGIKVLCHKRKACPLTPNAD